LKSIFTLLNRLLALFSLELRRKSSVSALPSAMNGKGAPLPALTISIEMMSRMFWERVFSDSEFWLRDKQEDFFRSLAELDHLKSAADFKTGSISSSTAWCLYCVARYFCPKDVIEIGTYIGKSTTAIAMGMADGGVEGGSIHTCDFSNEIPLPEIDKVRIVQYKKTSSLDMLRTLQGSGSYAFYHVDGRLGDQDVDLIDILAADDAIIALDDFEGVEKGVANYTKIRDSSLLATHTLIYPCDTASLAKIGMGGRSTTAILFPKRLIWLTNQ
jgi:predicted O-methyltransferase YrrM